MMRVPEKGHATLRRILVARGLIDPVAEWLPLSGGRTNTVWRIGNGRRAVVCKLYRESDDNLLFPNSPEDEVAALIALAGTGLAPEFCASVGCGLGTCVIYRHVSGDPFSGDIESFARALHRLHLFSARPSGLRTPPSNATAIAAQGKAMLADTPPALRGNLDELMPRVPELPDLPPSFLHGDPVPANILLTDAGPTFIDWQCPGAGDPCHDISVFFSPAMQSLYGNASLPQDAMGRFFHHYESPRIKTRFAALRPLLGWRMAVYCCWKAAQGASDYAPLVRLELESALDQQHR